MQGNHDLEVKLPSGSEVGSAAFHPPTIAEPVPADSGWRSKVDRIRESAVERAHSLRNDGEVKLHELSDRADALKSSVGDRMTRTAADAREQVYVSVNRMNHSMHDNPFKWVGIAAGAGFAVGLVSRIIDHYNHKRHVPQLVVIESAQ